VETAIILWTLDIQRATGFLSALQYSGVDSQSDCSDFGDGAVLEPVTFSSSLVLDIHFNSAGALHCTSSARLLGVGSHLNISLAWQLYIDFISLFIGFLGVGSLFQFSLARFQLFLHFVKHFTLNVADGDYFRIFGLPYLLAQRLALVWTLTPDFLHWHWTYVDIFINFWQGFLLIIEKLWLAASCGGVPTQTWFRDRKPGPKSRHWIPVFLLIICCVWNCQLAPSCTGSDRSEGCTVAMDSAETSTDWTHHFIHRSDVKLHGKRPPMCASTPVELTHRASPVVKRSLQRAQKRAQRSGMAWYRGRCLTPEDFLKMGMRPLNTDLPPMTPANLATCNMHNAPRKRLTCLTWNGGGLSNHRLDELKCWLVQQQIQIAAVTETRWSFCSTWSDNSWHHIHSADPDHRGSGVLILVAKTLCDANNLRWNDIVPGRLLHVRLHMNPRNIDILGCYQHVFARDKGCLQRRERFRLALEQQLQQIPNRNTVAVLGGLNCSLMESSGTCGTSFFRWNHQLLHGLKHSDSERFAQILRSGGLVALNTWDSSLGPTFVQNGCASRIDFICTRRHLADGQARRVQYLWEAPFLPPGQYGHVPMVCHLAKYWVPPAHHNANSLTPHQKRCGRLAKLSGDVAWRHFLAASGDTICDQFHRVLTLAESELSRVHDTAINCFSQSFPAVSAIRSPDPWQTNTVVLSKWAHRSHARQIQTSDLHGCFHAWFHIAKYQMLTRSHRRFAQKQRRQRFEEIVQLANQAALQHNTHQMFDIINRFAPKTPMRRMQLRNDLGALMTISEERSMLVAYVRQTWHGHPMTLRPCHSPPGVPFTVQELAGALRDIPTVKAVAPPCAPGCIWNSHADTIAPILHEILNQWWNTHNPWIPAMWRSGWLQLIPKPNKPPNRPQHLRPLAIQCPLGKAVLGLLIRIASKQTECEFRKWPIWAFMPKRSTQDPLLKVASHCREIQILVAAQKSTPHSRAAQIPHFSCFGGLQIFIDIDKAFDSVNRTKLFCRLHQLQIDDAVIQLLQRWHFDTSYFVTHGGECVEVKVNRGLRQGCKGAPYLWNCMIVLLLHELQATVSLHWICTHLTIYADDCHVGGVFANVEEFKLLLQTIGQLFSLLHEFDLTISPQKSVAILCMRGHLGRKARAANTQRDHKGEQLKIQLPNATVMLIPVQKSANYLGCVIGYHNFADSTTWHRVKLARAGFSRLRRWLCNRTHFSIQQRVRLWRCCILPIMTYGVFAVGTTPKGIQHMITQIGLMLRTIVRDHPHHTGNSHEQVFSAFALPRPAALLTAAVDSFQRSLTQRKSILHADDLAMTLQWDHLALIRTQISEVQADLARRRVETALSGEVQGSDIRYHCRLCSFCTDHVSAFRRHCTVAHGTQMYRHFNISMHDYCTDGLPQCKYCHHSFSTWRSFRIHIERGCQALLLGPAHCTGIPLKATMTSSLKLPTDAASARGLVMLNDADLQNILAQPWGSRVLGMIADDRLSQLEQEPEACKYLCKFCFLCGQHAHRIQDMHWHLSTEHPQYWTHVPAKSRMMCNQYCTDSPCQFCGSGFRTHQCPIWAQMAILVLHGGGLASLGPVQIQTQLEAIHRCDVCFELFNDSAQLIQHLQRVHRLLE